MAVPVRAAGPAFEPGIATVLFPIPASGPGPLSRLYAPSGNGQRFLIARRLDETSGVPMTVVLNWQAGIKK